jgi:hypothetical protein
LFDINQFLAEEYPQEKWVTQAKQFNHSDDLNGWMRKHSSVISVKNIKLQSSDDWDAYLVIFEIKESDLEKLGD